jgi:hypothetical protein
MVVYKCFVILTHKHQKLKQYEKMKDYF